MTRLPLHLQKLEQKEPENACMQEMWNDGVCNPSCNNFVCGHNDCTAQQIIDKCVADQDFTGIGFTSPPLGEFEMHTSQGVPLVPINMQLRLSPLRLEIDMAINEMVLTNEVGFTLQWQDDRMAKSPCRAVLTNMLSMSRDEAKSDIQRAAKTAYKVPPPPAPHFAATAQIAPFPDRCATGCLASMRRTPHPAFTPFSTRRATCLSR